MAHYGGYAMAVPHGYAQAPLYFQGAAFVVGLLLKDPFVTNIVLEGSFASPEKNGYLNHLY